MWMKNFRTRKSQTVMIFLVIMLCSTLLTGAVSILIALEKPFGAFSKECDAASAVLYTYAEDEPDIRALGEEFAALDVVDRVEYIKNYNINENVTVEGKKLVSFFRLTEYNDLVYDKVRYLEGDKGAANSLKEGECIIPACISTTYDVHIGDVVKIQFSSEEKSFVVRGVFAYPYSASTAYDCDILINKIPESMDSKLTIYLYGQEGITGSDIESAYRGKYDGQMNGQMVTLEEMISNSLITGHILGAMFLSIGIIMLFVSVLIIHFMVRNAMIKDAKNIAIYKTIGYTSSDILKMYMKFYFVIVTAACLLGIIGSVFLSNIVLTTVYENIGQVAGTNVIMPGILCYLLTVGFVLFIIWVIVGGTQKVKPVVALTGMTSEGIKKKRTYKGNSKMQFSSFGIALRTLMRSKKSAIGIVITCIFTIFSINFGIISLDLANTMKDNNDYWLGVDKCDVSISVADNTQLKSVSEEVERDERVDYSINSSYNQLITLKWSKGMENTTMYALVYQDYTRNHLPVVEGRNPKTGNEIAIASKMAGDLNKEVGDYIEVFLGGTKKVDLLITGIYQTYYQMGKSCRLTTDVYTENDYDLQYNTISVYLMKGENINSFINDIKKEVGGKGDVIPRTEMFSSIMDMIVKPQKQAIPPVIILVLLLGSVNIFSIILLKNANAQKMNGIYKCIGYSTGHLIRANLYYVGMIATISMVIALPIVILVYPSIMKLSLSAFGFIEYPVNYIWSHIALVNIGVIIIFVISTLVSSRSLRRVSARDLVQE